ncbi:Retrovirus-related Pol polyprotein from transposon TNT 1-94 [Dendrobium catenatum]|uniref:Retrovirus-related Pol polyprotein from transposon TNT 1-94 n=1 Tax=Dendrobium catenatum TaxID=906689 RepID=A0A2I0WBP1_9ASPA|nr:Retrovirus-related Pol polyprotein from transposon TNT 1-94 [Dendrobium catenatum]
MVEKQFSTQIKIFRSDAGGEYSSIPFRNFLSTKGIIHQFSCPYTPQQNGLAERKHRHIIETARTLLLQAHLPTQFWIEAVLTATYLINRLPSLTTNSLSPFQHLFKKQPVYTHLKIFGCLCFPWLQHSASHKFAPKSSACVFLGYSSSHKGYRCYQLSNQKIIISRHVQFHEHVFPFASSAPTNSNISTTNPTSIAAPLSLVPYTLTNAALHPPTSLPTEHTHLPDLPISHFTNDTAPHSPHSLPIQQANTSLPDPLPSVLPQTRHTMVTRLKTGSLKPKQHFDLQHKLTKISDPTCYSVAVKHQCWRDAMSTEFQALQAQGTWDLVPSPPNQIVLGCKWIYKTKRHSDGSIARYKAPFVAQGFRQEYGIDYTETFSPVAKFPTLRLFIAAVVHSHWPITQLDVSNAFLHGDLHETVYMNHLNQPPGFKDSQHPDFVCRLHKAIYGLKQSPRMWFAKFTTHLQSLRFRHSDADPSLLIYSSKSHHIYLLVYVDDILLTGSSTVAIQSLIRNLQHNFQIRNLGGLNNFLGIHAISTPTSFHLNQASYASDILQRARFLTCKPVVTPFSLKPVVDDTSLLLFENPEFYRQIVGALQYLTLTWPDISYDVNKQCQYMHTPLRHHFQALKHLLRYLRGTVEFGLPINNTSSSLRAYADSDWAGDPINRKSTTGYCIFLGDTLLSWCVKKQPTVARSSTEAEYRALATAATDIVWIWRLLAEFRFINSAPTPLYCDNVSAIALAHNPIFHARTKHIEVDYHFIRDFVKSNSTTVHHINTQDQVADIFTKTLPRLRYNLLHDKLMVSPIPSACGGLLKCSESEQNTSLHTVHH